MDDLQERANGERKSYGELITEIAAAFPFAYKTVPSLEQRGTLVGRFGQPAPHITRYDQTTHTGLINISDDQLWAAFFPPPYVSTSEWIIVLFKTEKLAVEAKLLGWNGERLNIMDVITDVYK